MQRRPFACLLALGAALAMAAPVRAQFVEPRIDATGPFDSLVVTGAGQVRLFQAERDEVVIPGDKRLLANVSVQRAGSTLTIGLPRDPALLGALAQVEVHVARLTRLTLADSSSVSAPLSFKGDVMAIRMNGSGLVAFDNLSVSQLTVDLAASAQARLAGKVDKLRLTTAGTSRFVADGLRARSIELRVAAASGADVWSVDELDAQVSGSGRVRYWGEAKVTSSIVGQGSIDSRGVR